LPLLGSLWLALTLALAVTVPVAFGSTVMVMVALALLASVPSEQLTVGALIEQDAELAKNPEKQQEMRRIFSAFRYAFGHHQAKWPVVCADTEVAEYVASARETYGKADLFWAWCADNLDLQ